METTLQSHTRCLCIFSSNF